MINFLRVCRPASASPAEAHLSACVWSKRSESDPLRKESITRHVHGFLDCIVAFLGEGSWFITRATSRQGRSQLTIPLPFLPKQFI